MFSRAVVPISTLWLGLAACHGEPPAVAAPTPIARLPIAPRCPELRSPRAVSGGAPRIFVEIAQLDPHLHTQRVGHLLMNNEEASTLPWDATSAIEPDARRWDLKVIPHIDSTTPSSLRLEVDLAPAPPLGTPLESWSVPQHRRVHTTLVLAEQQSIVLGVPPAPGAAPLSLLITPYFIREEADLRRLFECKMRAGRG